MALTEEIADKLGFYVYRLIDPRNGETFYVGRGKGNRVFNHAADELGAGADLQSEKLQRIRKIRSTGFTVAHVIHRHGLDSHTAVEVEAALIDAYPGTTNVASGHEADERGVMHADEIIRRYQAPVARFEHDLVLISVNWSALERPIYEAVRHAWRIDPRKAARADYVLGVYRGLIVGAFQADRWLRATSENFPGHCQSKIECSAGTTESIFAAVDFPRFLGADPGDFTAVSGIQNFALTMPRSCSRVASSSPRGSWPEHHGPHPIKVLTVCVQKEYKGRNGSSGDWRQLYDNKRALTVPRRPTGPCL